MKNISWLILVLGLSFAPSGFARVPKNNPDWAKQQCLKENPKLKGKALQKCIKVKKLRY